MNTKYTALGVLLAAAMILAGCAGSFSDQPQQNEDRASPVAVETESRLEPAPSKTADVETPDLRDKRPEQTPPTPERVEITPPERVTGEVPTEIMEAISADLVERTGTKSADINVIRAEAVVWNDGALGCPMPGEFYIQMLIDGYWVVLEVEGVAYDYRVADKGSFKLCEGGLRGLPVPPGAPGSGPAPEQ